MKIDIYTKFTGVDKFGMPIAEKKRDYEKSHSLVQAFPAILYTCIANATVASVPDSTNTARTLQVGGSGGNFSVVAGTDLAQLGIQAGTGTNAVAITDYALQTRIVNGTSSGQLQYSSTTFGGWTVSGSDAYIQVFRTFTNGSGANITINEIAFQCRADGTATHYFCIERTKPTPYTVNNGAGVIVEYKFLYSV